MNRETPIANAEFTGVTKMPSLENGGINFLHRKNNNLYSKNAVYIYIHT